ncbi:MAG: GNAT family N-acetyltransferase [Christensenella sp.]|nr:GNAT family N-acetyltransferase [Christensenella sp.]
MKSIKIRHANKSDAALVLDFIKKIAVYEKMQDQVSATAEDLETYIFDRKAADVLIAECDGKPVGFALFFENFSTFIGRTGLYLEDIYVDRDMRGLGIGKKLFQAVAAQAAERGCQRMEWCCLNWNQPSIDFYHYMGAQPMDDWTTFRLSGRAIRDAINK